MAPAKPAAPVQPRPDAEPVTAAEPVAAHAHSATPRRNPALQLLRQTGRAGTRIAAVVVVVAGFAFPFAIMVTTSFKTTGDIFHAPPRFWPASWTLASFQAAFLQMPFWHYLGNTVLLCVLNVLGTLVACPLVAYSLAKVGWRGRGPLLVLVLATMMLPPQVTLIPIYLIWNGLHAVNTYWPLVVPAFCGTPFLIFMIRQFLISLPDELIESARIDGASELRIYLRVVLPLARPALATAAVFQFVWTWTDFLNPLIYLNDPGKYTLSIGLYNFFSEHGVAWGPLMAACVLFTIPAFVIFLAGQRYFVEGIATRGFK
jgi:multiple sugar transport system permease protein